MKAQVIFENLIIAALIAIIAVGVINCTKNGRHPNLPKRSQRRTKSSTRPQKNSIRSWWSSVRGNWRNNFVLRRGNLGDLILECVWGRALKAEILRNPCRCPEERTEKLNPPSFPKKWNPSQLLLRLKLFFQNIRRFFKFFYVFVELNTLIKHLSVNFVQVKNKLARIFELCFSKKAFVEILK